MSLEQTIDKFKQEDAAPPSRFGPERYWAPCLAVALVAVSLFYVTLKDLVHESAARTPALPPAVMSAHVEAKGATTRSSEEPAPPTPHRAPLANATFEAPVIAPAEPTAKAAPAFVEVQKCVMPEGDAVYSDEPCPEGASASTLRLPRNLHAAARL